MSAATGGAGTGTIGEIVTAENRTIIEKGGILSIRKFWKHLASAEFTRERRIVDSQPDITMFYLYNQGERIHYNTHLTVSGMPTEHERIMGTVVGIYNTRAGERGLVVERTGRTNFIPANRIKTVELIPSHVGGRRKRQSHKRQSHKRQSHKRQSHRHY
jgi:hypothetical protein